MSDREQVEAKHRRSIEQQFHEYRCSHPMTQAELDATLKSATERFKNAMTTYAKDKGIVLKDDVTEIMLMDLLDKVTESATERMACGHLPGDMVYDQADYLDGTTADASHCRTCAEIKSARVESESNVAKHILTAAPDGCVCEPCISARTLTQSAYDRGVPDGIEPIACVSSNSGKCRKCGVVTWRRIPYFDGQAGICWLPECKECGRNPPARRAGKDE